MKITLGEKLSSLRKKHGWSQEGIAEKLDVSRQSISKWESDLSVPDIYKIVKLSEIYSVSTDCLLKSEAQEALEQGSSNKVKVKELSSDEVKRYIEISKKGSEKQKCINLECLLEFSFSSLSSLELYTWIIWPNAEVLYGAIISVVEIIGEKK